MQVLSPIYKSLSAQKLIYSMVKHLTMTNLYPVTGIDALGLSINKITTNNMEFNGDVAIVSEDSPYLHNGIVFLNGIPFKIIGVIPKMKMDFLDSLGLSKYQSNNQLFVPLSTLFRFKLSSNIDNVKIVLSDKVGENDINTTKKTLGEEKIPEYNIITALDVRTTVDKVLNRFSMLLKHYIYNVDIVCCGYMHCVV
ncbi:hypothetical protein MOQ27_20755 [Escherichia coli]|uniref:ABC transporter permease n=1 Tax=Escherichia coli TaxID=562 RepID=UPI0021483F97|nr:ABC transporter permease [Escherichia coli]MCR1124463.1 hypothetical protein [Escherichia coli]